MTPCAIGNYYLLVHGSYLEAHLPTNSERPLSLNEALTCGTADQIILELGCGSAALPSIVAVRKGYTIIATDIDECLDVAKRNLDENANSTKSTVVSHFAADDAGQVRREQAVVAKLEWGPNSVETLESELSLDMNTFKAGLIVAADVVYNPDSVKPLLSAMQSLAKRCLCSIIIATKARRQLLGEFCKEAEHLGFVIETITTVLDDDLQDNVVIQRFSLSGSDKCIYRLI